MRNGFRPFDPEPMQNFSIGDRIICNGDSDVTMSYNHNSNIPYKGTLVLISTKHHVAKGWRVTAWIRRDDLPFLWEVVFHANNDTEMFLEEENE